LLITLFPFSAFVNRNVQAPFQTLDEAEFNRVINRKNCQLHRVSSSSKKGTPTSRKPAVNKRNPKKVADKRKYLNNQTEKSPVKIISPVKIVTPRKSPLKSLNPMKSPAKLVSPRKSQNLVQSPQKMPWSVSRMASQGVHQGIVPEDFAGFAILSYCYTNFTPF
jgi:hypothetical protein